MARREKPTPRVRTATAAEARALAARERSLREADRADGGHRYRDFRAEEDRRFRASLAADRRDLREWRAGR